MGCTTFKPHAYLHGDCFILVSLSSQVLLALLALFLVRFKLSVGSGFLYGPMLFLALINQIPFDQHYNYVSLDKAVSIITSIPIALMNLEVFSFIPWCFYSLLAQIYNYRVSYILAHGGSLSNGCCCSYTLMESHLDSLVEGITNKSNSHTNTSLILVTC